MEHHKYCLYDLSFRDCTCQPRLVLEDDPLARLARFSEMIEAVREYDAASRVGVDPEALAAAESRLRMCARKLVAADQDFLDTLTVNLSSPSFPSNHVNTFEDIQRVFASLKGKGKTEDLRVPRTDMRPVHMSYA